MKAVKTIVSAVSMLAGNSVRVILCMCLFALVQLLVPAGSLQMLGPVPALAQDTDTEDEEDSEEDSDEESSDDSERSEADEAADMEEDIVYRLRSREVVKTAGKRSRSAVVPTTNKRRKARLPRKPAVRRESRDVSDSTSTSTTDSPAPRRSARQRDSRTIHQATKELNESTTRKRRNKRRGWRPSARTQLSGKDITWTFGPEVMVPVRKSDGSGETLVLLDEFKSDVSSLPSERPRLNYYKPKVYSGGKPEHMLAGRVQILSRDGNLETIAEHNESAEMFYPLMQYSGIKDSPDDRRQARSDNSKFNGRFEMSLGTRDRGRVSGNLKTASIHTEEQFIDVVAKEIEAEFDSMSDSDIDDIEFLIVDINQHLTACTGCFSNIIGGDLVKTKWKSGSRDWTKILERVGGKLGKNLSHINVIVRLDAYSAKSISGSNYFPKTSYYEKNMGDMIVPVLPRGNAVVVTVPKTTRMDAQSIQAKRVFQLHKGESTSSTSTSTTNR